MALLSVVKLELNKGVNNMGFGSGLKAVRRMTPEEIASNNKLKAESKASKQQQLQLNRPCATHHLI
jgi:hypothetical protein